MKNLFILLSALCSFLFADGFSSSGSLNVPGAAGLSAAEFGSIKNYDCGKDCHFNIYKIYGEGDSLCFKNRNEAEVCFAVENCNFYGFVENKEGIKEIQVGKNTLPNEMYQYVLAEGEVKNSPALASDDDIECFAPSSTYFPSERLCKVTSGLDFRNWDIVGENNTKYKAVWEFKNEGTIGVQLTNTQYNTLLLNPNTFGEEVDLTGSIKVTSGNDNDWIGLVFGFKDDNDYYVFDWKGGNQGGTKKGFRLMHVHKLAANVWTADSTGDLDVLDSNYDEAGWSKGSSYKIRIKYIKGEVWGYLNGKEVIHYKNDGEDFSGKAGFFGNSQDHVEYSDFLLKTSPKCPPGYDYDHDTRFCLKKSQNDLANNVIYSTCKINGHVGGVYAKNGPTSVVSGSLISGSEPFLLSEKTNNVSAAKSEDLGSFDKNNRLYFWDPYKNGYLGFLEFVKDVKEGDRLDGFAAKEKLPYVISKEGFTSIGSIAGKTYFVSLDEIGTPKMTDSKCDAYASRFGLSKVTSLSGSEKDFVSILAGGKTNWASLTPNCLSGEFDSATGTCKNASNENMAVPYCMYGVMEKNAAGTFTCKINPRCVLVSEGIKTFNFSDYATKSTKIKSNTKFVCSPIQCVDGKCKTETCPDGYLGNLLPDGYEPEEDECVKNVCDGNKPYVSTCGKKAGCPVGPQYLSMEDDNTCYKYTCPNGDIHFNPETKKCKVKKCPPNTTDNNDGTCRRN